MSPPAGIFFLLTSLTIHLVASFLSLAARSGKSDSRVTALTANDQRDVDYEMYGVRIDAKTMDPEIFRDLYDGHLPVVIREAFHRTLVDEDAWVKSLVERFSSTTVQFDVRHGESGEVEVFEGFFQDFLETCSSQSTHGQSLYFMSETMLASAKDLMQKVRLPKNFFGENYFESSFPEKIRPQTALIVGGLGSRSFLHADPYEWTGWNYLLEGKKLWIIFPPDDETLDQLLQPSRNEVDAWGGVNISAGWVSDVDLYKYICDENDLCSLGKTLSKHLPIGKEIPFFKSGIHAVDNADPCIYRNVVCIIQEEGEMVIIPPKWWHQVYHLEPSIALAGQYVNDKVKENVVNHMYKWSNVDTDKMWSPDIEHDLRNRDTKQRILEAIEIALKSQHGEDIGKMMFDDMQSVNKDCDGAVNE